MATKSRSKRSARFWDRLVGWYGTRLKEQYGDEPPEDWCELVDDATNHVVKAALAEIRRTHVTHPPTFPELDRIFFRLQRPDIDTGPSVMERLCVYALKHKRLTEKQIRVPWTYLYRGDCGTSLRPASPDYACTGVVIPADGERPGYRIMVEDMEIAEAAA